MNNVRSADKTWHELLSGSEEHRDLFPPILGDKHQVCFVNVESENSSSSPINFWKDFLQRFLDVLKEFLFESCCEVLLKRLVVCSLELEEKQNTTLAQSICCDGKKNCCPECVPRKTDSDMAAEKKLQDIISDGEDSDELENGSSLFAKPVKTTTKESKQ
jgi:hypothetical protein